MKFPRKLRTVLIGVAVLLAGLAILYHVPTGYDPAKVHPIIGGIHKSVKRLELSPFPNGFLCVCEMFAGLGREAPTKRGRIDETICCGLYIATE